MDDNSAVTQTYGSKRKLKGDMFDDGDAGLNFSIASLVDPNALFADVSPIKPVAHVSSDLTSNNPRRKKAVSKVN